MIYKKSVSRDSSPLRDGSPVKRERDFIPTLHIRGRDASPVTSARDSLDSPSTGRTSSSSPPSSPAPLTPTTPHVLRARSHSDSHIPFGDSLLHRMSHNSLQNNSAGKITINADWGAKSPTSPHPPVAPNAPSGGFFFQTPRSPPQASQPVLNSHPVQQQGPFHVHLPGQTTASYSNSAAVQVNSPHSGYYSAHHEIVSNELNLNHAPHRTAPHLNSHYAPHNAPFIKEEMTVDTHQIVDKMNATVLYDAQTAVPHSHVEDWHKQHAQSRVPLSGGYELNNYSTGDEMGDEGSAFSPLDDPLMQEDADAGDFIMQHDQGTHWEQNQQHAKPGSAFSYHNQSYNQWSNNTNH